MISVVAYLSIGFGMAMYILASDRMKDDDREFRNIGDVFVMTVFVTIFWPMGLLTLVLN